MHTRNCNKTRYTARKIYREREKNQQNAKDRKSNGLDDGDLIHDDQPDKGQDEEILTKSDGFSASEVSFLFLFI